MFGYNWHRRQVTPNNTKLNKFLFNTSLNSVRLKIARYIIFFLKEYQVVRLRGIKSINLFLFKIFFLQILDHFEKHFLYVIAIKK